MRTMSTVHFKGSCMCAPCPQYILPVTYAVTAVDISGKCCVSSLLLKVNSLFIFKQVVCHCMCMFIVLHATVCFCMFVVGYPQTP